jgi:hypothetical protein
VVRHWDGGSNIRANKTISTLLPHRRWPLWRCLRVDGNMRWSILQRQSGLSRARMLIWRWWICRSSLTLSMGGSGSWSKIAWGHPPVDMPQWHVPWCMQQACSSAHKASLVMVLSWIWQWWRLNVSFGVHLGDAGVGWRPLASVVAGNPRDWFVFIDLLRFYLQNFQDNHCILVYLLVSKWVAPCKLIFN